MPMYYYSNNIYSTKEELDAAVTELRARLENNPTAWVEVKELSGDAITGWVVTPVSLTDEQILLLDSNKHYSVVSLYEGSAFVGLDGVAAAEKVADLRRTYAQIVQANTISEVYSPTNEDMSVYVM